MDPNLAKLKNKRTSVRGTLTRLINKIETSFENNETLEHFEQHLEQIIDKENSLNKINLEIEDLLDADAISAEVEASEEIKEKIIIWKCKLSKKIREISNVASIQADTVSKSTVDNFVEVNQLNRNKISVNLPILNIPKFYGDYSKWLDFYNLFETSIDNNPNLNKIEKFTYLKSYLAGSAAECINGFSINEKNYDDAILLLKNRFGNKNVLINTHLNILLNMQPVKFSNDVNGLRKLYDEAETRIRCLQSLGIESDCYDKLLCPILMKIIPPDLILNFNRIHESDDFDLKSLLSFLNNEILNRERLLSIHKQDKNEDRVVKKHSYSLSKSSPKQNKEKPRPSVSEFMTNAVSSENESICLFCQNQHKPENCNYRVDKRREILRSQGRCYICLERSHVMQKCRNKNDKCPICDKSGHNMVLCYKKERLGTEKESIVSAVFKTKPKLNNSRIMLQTCTAVVQEENKEETIRLFLDNGSQRSFIHRNISRKLKLPIIRQERLSLCTFGSKETETKTFNVVKVKLKNRNDPNLNIEIEAIETDQISAIHLSTPDQNIINKYKHLKHLQLADSYEHDSKEIVILIGADFYYDVVTGRIRRLDKKLVAVETIFGWSLQGQTNTSNELLTMNVLVNETNICDQLTQFWQLENLGVESETIVDKTESEILESFNSTIKYENNRYTVKLPWKQEMKQKLSDNKDIAKKRFFNLNKKLQGNIPLYNDYKLILKTYLEENIIEYVNDECVAYTDNPSYYLPHRGVIREDKTTSKLRIVFDASSHAPGEVSLNDCLESGPHLNPDIFELLIRFRNFPIGFTSDIKQAFLQIKISEEDRDVTRFFWSDDDKNNLHILRFSRVLFGINASPFLLAATIKYHLKKFEKTHPEVYTLLNECLYVDDVIGGHEDVDGAFRVSLECRDVFLKAGMVLRKFQTSSQELRDRWKESGLSVEESSGTVLETESLKVLGMSWDTNIDSFYFDSRPLEKFLEKRTNTKRFLLQVAGRIFDPLGLLSPFTIIIKCLIQEIWTAGTDWDEEIPKDINYKWTKWCDNIQDIAKLKIPRHYFLKDHDKVIKSIELHSFSDASLKAYGAVIYFRTEYQDGSIHTSLATSKSRVSPLKTLSLPRLELLGALLASRLSSRVSTSLKTPLKKYWWTDSTITYFWIRKAPRDFKPFVKNRVEEIQKLTEPSRWSHCPGNSNPADLPSRGVAISQLIHNDLWWHGPPWLRKSKEFWPKSENLNVEDDKLEYRSNRNHHAQQFEILVNKEKLIDLDKFSNLIKPLRISAWIKRFIWNCRNSSKKSGPLTGQELTEAEEFWIRYTQNCAYSSEIKSLYEGKNINKDSKIASLVPFLDERKILRIKGRLEQSEFTFDEKHPIILPRDSKLAELIIQREHERVLHCGIDITLVGVRKRFWIPKGRQLIKRIIKRCLICNKYSAKAANQITAPLPKDRIVETPPFSVCGIDFAGPIYLKEGSNILKSYITLFTCAVTRAVHLELVSNQSTRSFILAFRRFLARREHCTIIYSDNAKTFKSADKEFQCFQKLLQDENLHNFITSKGINWKYIVERAAWWGGFYERLIKTIKDSIRKTLGKALLSFEEMSTLLTEVELVMNSRPLTYAYNEFEEPEPLTPSHFLNFEKKDNTFPIHFIDLITKSSSSADLKRRKKYQCNLLKNLWTRWKTQYLMNLRTAHNFKSHDQGTVLNVGDVVLLEGNSKNKLLWTLGVIKELFKGRDGHARACVIKTKDGLYRRPINLLYKLEMNN